MSETPAPGSHFSTPTSARLHALFGQWRIVWQCLSLDDMKALKSALRRDHIDDDLYVLRVRSHPFLQGEDESRCHESKGWALVEFWTSSYDKEHIEAWVRAVYKHIWGSEPEELIFLS